VIIALSGQIGTGKTTAADYLNKNHGFRILSTRNLLASILKAKNVEVTRKNLQDLGSALIFVTGGGGFVAMMLEYIRDGNCVLDAVRYPEAISYLRSTYRSQFAHVHLSVRDEIRYLRLEKRDRDRGAVENYTQSERAETELAGPELEKVSDFRIDNSGTPPALYSELDRIVRSMTQRERSVSR